jgi:RND family efflux transporter MFP subunit
MTVLAPCRRTVPLLVGLLLAGAVGCHHTTPPPEEEHAPQAPVQAEPAKKVVLGTWTDLLGTTVPLPKQSARVSAAVEGHVLWVLGNGKGPAVVEGQQVEKGQVIVQMDDRVLRANRDKLEATLHDLDQQQKQAEFAVELAQIDVNRLKELLPNAPGGSTALPLVSRVELEKAQVLHKDAQSKLKAVAARQAATRADLKAVEQQLEFFTLSAPISGRLGIVSAVPGQTLTPGTVVAEVVNLDPIDVLCYVPADTVTRLALDQPAKLVALEGAAAAARTAQRGKVAFIGVQADPATGNVPVKVRFPNPGFGLRAHAVVRVQVLTSPEQERLTIPEACIMEDLEVPVVTAVEDVKTEKKGDEEQQVGKVRTLQAVLGVRDRDKHIVEVLDLEDPATKEKVAAEGLLFVTAGGNGLKTGDAVKLRKPEPTEDKK